MNDEKTSRSIWIISTEPASTDYGQSELSSSHLRFREQIPIGALKRIVSDFANDIGEVFDGIADADRNYSVETIEIQAMMAADGKLGILGSSIGGKTEGTVKFILKRNDNQQTAG